MQMYFIAIVLPQHLDKEVQQWKEYMQLKYKCRVALKSPAHITIIPPFWLDTNKEEQLLTDVEKIALQVEPFAIATNNYSAFKPRTIYIDVEKNEALNKLKALTDEFFKHNDTYDIKQESHPFHPHITIATRDLYKKDFYEAWPLFENKTFIETWQADGLSVLRHNTKNWEVIQTSAFTGKNL